MGTASRKKHEFWRQHVEAYKASGTSAKAYCRKHNLKPPTLRYWRVFFGEALQRKGPRPKQLMPVKLAAALAPASPSLTRSPISSAARITLPDGTMIETSGDLETLAHLANLLRGGRS